MTQHFHPTLLARGFYLILACGLSILFLVACLLLRTIGTRFAGDVSDFITLISAVLIFAAILLLGFVILHLLRLAFSLSPSWTIDGEGIQYRRIGSFGTARVHWRDIAGAKRKGIFKHYSLILSLRPTANIEGKQNFLYVVVKNIFSLIFPSRLRTIKSGFGHKNPKAPSFIRIFEPTINIPIEKLEKLVQGKIDLYYLNPKAATALLSSDQHNNVSARHQSIKTGYSMGYVSRAIPLGIVILLPITSFLLGFERHQRNLGSDPQVKITQLLLKRAKAGNADAQNKMGWRYDRGVGVGKSRSRAVYWYKLSAKQGFAKAQYNLGLAYYYKRGVKRDYRKSIEWFSKAAGRVNGRAEYFLGVMHEKGKGVAKSTGKATNFYRKSAALGYSRGKKALRRMTKQTSHLN